MPSGLDATGGWVGAPTDLPGFGDIQWEGAGSGWGRGVSGGDWLELAGGISAGGENAGFERISTGIDLGEPIPGPAGSKQTDWRALFNYQTNPTFWILLFAHAAIGFIHARLSVGGSVGRVRAAGGVHV